MKTTHAKTRAGASRHVQSVGFGLIASAREKYTTRATRNWGHNLRGGVDSGWVELMLTFCRFVDSVGCFPFGDACVYDPERLPSGDRFLFLLSNRSRNSPLPFCCCCNRK